MSFNTDKVVIFDFDGTLTFNTPNPYISLLRRAGVSQRICKKLLNSKLVNSPRFLKIGMRMCSMVIKNAQITKEEFKDIAEKTQLLPLARECLRSLHENGYKLYIVSDSIVPVIKSALSEDNDIFDGVYGFDIEWTNQNTFAKLKNSKGKVAHIKDILIDNNLPASHALYFGNGANDLCVKQTGVQTCCLNPENSHAKPENSKFWDYKLENVKNFSIVYNFITEMFGSHLYLPSHTQTAEPCEKI